MEKNPTIHICEKCDRTFANERNLEQHTRKNSCKKVIYYCKKCNKGFSSESSMYRHMRDTCKTKEKEKDADDKIINEIASKIEKKMEKKIKTIENLIKTIKKQENSNVCFVNNNESLKATTIIDSVYGNTQKYNFPDLAPKMKALEEWIAINDYEENRKEMKNKLKIKLAQYEK